MGQRLSSDPSAKKFTVVAEPVAIVRAVPDTDETATAIETETTTAIEETITVTEKTTAEMEEVPLQDEQTLLPAETYRIASIATVAPMPVEVVVMPKKSKKHKKK